MPHANSYRRKPYPCTYCSKLQSLHGNLQIHIRIQTPYQCQYCSCRFSDSGKLKLHLLIHKERNLISVNTNLDMITLFIIINNFIQVRSLTSQCQYFQDTSTMNSALNNHLRCILVTLTSASIADSAIC